ncbi:Hox cluster protein ShxB [Operophtera brumata]|uniref:Hox cluster protein ShxB n=1 Tax=Operophtera brumata TaxID=104452 RepID=A0A0L7LKL4_OPEBR|nr:Hox cluster protein ShxB [Operophtera brumata]
MEPGSSSMIIIRPIWKPKRFRSAFTTEQIQFLEQQFKKFPYVSSEHRKEISMALKIKEKAIKIWFQNRRMKEKKESINKELDNVRTNEVDSQDQLNNVCNLSSANEQHLYPLPTIMKSVETSKKLTKTNTDSVYSQNRDQVNTTMQVSQNLPTNNINSHMNINEDLNIKTQLPLEPSRNVDLTQINLTQSGKFKNKVQVPAAYFLNDDSTQRNSLQRGQCKNKNPSIYRKSADFRTDSKKLKKEIKHLINPIHKPKIQRKEVPGHPTISVKPKISPEDFSSNKKARPPDTPPRQATLNSPAYYPVMPTFYPHPFISPGRVIWKPMHIMPAMPPGTAISVPSNHQARFRHDQNHNCYCNCHGNPQPFTVPATQISAYPQYVISSPFQNPIP